MLNIIYKPIEEDLKEVARAVKRELGSEGRLISDILYHLLSVKGKLLRPALVLLTGGLGPKRNKGLVIKLATSIELIHMATLIHDDIIDGAKIRRNYSTLNLKYGDEISVIIGDYIYSRAFRLLSSIGSTYILKSLASTAQMMCEGELKEVEHRYNTNLGEEDYIFLVKQKTASLIRSCCQLGCWLSGASKAQSKIMADYGMNLGIAFQIADDCLDFIGDAMVMGKSLYSDIRNGKLTLPIIYLLNRLSRPRREKIIHYMRDGSKINYVIELAKDSGMVDEAYKKATIYAAQAKAKLDILDGSTLKENLALFADYVVSRKG